MTLDLRERLHRLEEEGNRLREELYTTVEVGGRRISLYNAGMKGGAVWFGPFGRDLLMTALILGEPEFAQAALRFAAETIGRKFDPKTGEEPGRGLHEFNRVEIRGLFTHYNAVEVSLLFLITADLYLREGGNAAFIDSIRLPLEAALDYLSRHVEDGLFVEDPHYCGATRYALRATYWKDSHLPGREDPDYPVIYTLVQAQAIAAVRAAARLRSYIRVPFEEARMEEKLLDRLVSTLWNHRANRPYIALDQTGKIDGVSSDALHLLFYLCPGDLSPDRLAGIEENAHHLATPVGYRTYAPGQLGYSPRAYHLGAIWPMEQYFIARGAAQHKLFEISKAALGTVAALERLGFVELYYWDEETGVRGPSRNGGDGCDLQLWSTAVPTGLVSAFETHED